MKRAYGLILTTVALAAFSGYMGAAFADDESTTTDEEISRGGGVRGGERGGIRGGERGGQRGGEIRGGERGGDRGGDRGNRGEVISNEGESEVAMDETQPQESPKPSAVKKTPTKPKYDPKKSFEKFSKQLSLTKEQQDKIRPILNDEVKAIKEMRKDKSLSKQQKMDKEKEIMDSHHSQVRELLKPEQQTKYDEIVKKHEAKMKAHQEKKEKKTEPAK